MERERCVGEATEQSVQITDTMMQSNRCEQMRRWLQQVSQASRIEPPPDELCTHVMQCEVCQGALLLLMSQAQQHSEPIMSITCEECQDELDTYIDIEREDGTLAAFEAYPSLWWHLVLCEDCYETYRLTNVLIDAQADGTLPPLPLPVPRAVKPDRPRLLKQLRIPHLFLSRTLSVQPLLGVARGADDGDMVLIEEEAEGYTITLSVQKQSATTWSVIMNVEPPVDGTVMLTLGATQFRVPFDEHGRAEITNVAEAVLTGTEGPDMLLAIEMHG